MKKPSMASPLILTLFLGLSSYAADQTVKKDPAPPVGTEGVVFPLVFHAGTADGDLFAGWGPLMGRDEIYNWGKSRGIYLIDDAGPVVDGRARFVARYGSALTITGLRREGRYRLWLDFVRFRRGERAGIDSRLEISMNGRVVKELVFNELPDSGAPYVLDIPFDLGQAGRVVVLFREHAASPGFWGVWDAVVTDRFDLPVILDRPPGKDRPKIPVKTVIVEEKKPAAKKKASRPGVLKPSAKPEPKKEPPVKKAVKPETKPKPPSDTVAERLPTRKAVEAKKPGDTAVTPPPHAPRENKDASDKKAPVRK